MSYLILAFISFGAGAYVATVYRDNLDLLRGKLGV